MSEEYDVNDIILQVNELLKQGYKIASTYWGKRKILSVWLIKDDDTRKFHIPFESRAQANEWIANARKVARVAHGRRPERRNRTEEIRESISGIKSIINELKDIVRDVYEFAQELKEKKEPTMEELVRNFFKENYGIEPIYISIEGDTMEITVEGMFEMGELTFIPIKDEVWSLSKFGYDKPLGLTLIYKKISESPYTRHIAEMLNSIYRMKK